MEEELKKLMLNLPRDVHRAIKSKAALEGKSLQQKVLELIEEDLED